VWYDDPASLALKYQVAADHGLKGIGFWNLDCLDYSSKDKLVQQQTRDMWDAVGRAVAAFEDSNPQAVSQS
jgi:di-N-acetylchitobiase